MEARQRLSPGVKALVCAVLALALAAVGIALTVASSSDGDEDKRPDFSTPTATLVAESIDDNLDAALREVESIDGGPELLQLLRAKDATGLVGMLRTEEATCVKGDERTGDLCAGLDVEAGVPARVEIGLLDYYMTPLLPEWIEDYLADDLFAGGDMEPRLVALDGNHVQLGLYYPPTEGRNTNGYVWVDAVLGEDAPVLFIGIQPGDTDLDVLAWWREWDAVGRALPIAALAPELVEAEATRQAFLTGPVEPGATPILEPTGAAAP